MRKPIRWTKKRMSLSIAALCGAAAAVLIILSCIYGGGSLMLGIKLIFGGSLTVGEDIPLADVTQFYHTFSTSTNPPHYQRYHFYKENDAYYFFHETREGNHWPLTEADATVTGTLRLTDAQWTQLLEDLSGGIVRKRGDSAASGGAGPWMYLYWSGDLDKFQEFSFATSARQSDFESLCQQLKSAASAP